MNVSIKDHNNPVISMFQQVLKNFKPHGKWVPRVQFEQTHGKTGPVMDGRKVLLSSKERSLCLCCDKQKSSTVNGVCLECEQSTKERPV
jgi:hypothetical protein